MPGNPLTLSSYIVAFAGAAKLAQAIMSVGDTPMTIKEYVFKVNITADFNAKSETDVALNVWIMSIKEKLTLDYKEHMGIDISCTIVPSAVLAAQT